MISRIHGRNWHVSWPTGLALSLAIASALIFFCMWLEKTEFGKAVILNQSHEDPKDENIQSFTDNETSRLLFKMNLKLIEIVSRSGRDHVNTREIQDVVQSGCDIESIRRMVADGYIKKTNHYFVEADKCAGRLLVALSHSN